MKKTLTMVIVLGLLVAGQSVASIIIEAEDGTLTGNTYVDARFDGWSGVDGKVARGFRDGGVNGFVHVPVPAARTWDKIGIRVRAGYGGAPPNFTQYADGNYRLFINGTYELTVVADWSTFSYTSDADNQVTMYTTGPVNVSADDTIWADSHWAHGMVDYFEFVPEPATLALLGLGGLACVRRRRAR